MNYWKFVKFVNIFPVKILRRTVFAKHQCAWQLCDIIIIGIYTHIRMYIHTYLAKGMLFLALQHNYQERILFYHLIHLPTISGVARPGPTRACALPSTSQALSSPTQLKSCDSTTNQTKVKKYIFILLC